MDNASKALMIAGEMLIAMLVVGLIAIAVSKFGGFSSSINRQLQKNKQEEFNNHFFAFQGRIDITADEIAGIINYAKYSNEKSELFLKDGTPIRNSPDFVDVKIDSHTFFDNLILGSINGTEHNFQEKLRVFLKENNVNFYTCDAKVVSCEEKEEGHEFGTIKIQYNDDNEDVLQHQVDNGRKGYVKCINFHTTSIKPSIQLTIYNRNDYIIE